MTNEEIALNAFKAKKWAEAMAAAAQTDRTNAEILLWMGYCYKRGYGVPKDIVQAFACFKKSAEGGNAPGMNELGLCYEYGWGTERDLKSAFKWYLEAVVGGNVSAMTNVGGMYEHGKGTAQDIAKAFRWYKMAAEKGHARGQFSLGRFYEYGKGTGKDISQAFLWYKKSAEGGHSGGMLALGRFYENGLGIRKDFIEAKKWYQKAKDAGNDDAEDALKELEEKLRPALGTTVTQTPDDNGAASVEEILNELDALTGLKAVKDEVKKLVGFVKAQKLKAEKGLKTVTIANHLVFTGNPGTGKTTVARIVSKIFNALGILKTDKLVETDRAGLVAKYIGQTADRTNRIVDSALDGVLFIDEAYALAEGGEKDYGREAVDTLLKRMEDDRDRLVVIVAGYTEEMKKFLNMNPGLKSRFKRHVNFPDYSADELTTIFKAMAERADCTIGDDVEKAVRVEMERELAMRQESFANARFVRTFFEKTLENQSVRIGQMKNPGNEDLQQILVSDLPVESGLEGKKEGIGDILKELDELVGIEPVKKEINILVAALRMQNHRKEKGLPVASVSYHCVFTGSPGTGKTTVARFMARVYNALGVTKTANLVEADRSKLVAEYVGQTAVKTNAIIDEALNGVLFIDEAYALANGGKNDFGHEAVDTLLKRMEDDRDRLVVIIAGYTDEMHKFIDMNPGLQSRFTRYIEFPDYSPEELTEIFARMARKEKYRFGDDVIRLVQDEMNALVAKKSKSFGNAREARTFYERVKERMSMRLAKVPDPSTEQLTELLPEDISDDATQADGTNPYDIIHEAAELKAAKDIFAFAMVNNRSLVKHCAYRVGKFLVHNLIRDESLAGQYPMMIRADISAALYIGMGAAVEYRLDPVRLDPQKIYDVMMCAGGLRKVAETGISKLGEFATTEVRSRLSAFDLAFQELAIEVAKRDGQLFDSRSMSREQTDGFCRLLHREAYAAFLTGFAIGTYLQREGSQEVVENGISVQIDYTHYLNLALAQNSRPLVSNLYIRNKTSDKLKLCKYRISCPENFLLEYSCSIGDIGLGKEFCSGTIPVRLNVDALRHVESIQTGYIRLEVFSEDKLLFKHDYRIEAVAPDHTHEILLQPDMLVAYVIPHCDAVRQMQSDAATLLGEGTGDGSLNGYQGDRERVAKICRAIYEAIRSKHVQYAESPATIGLAGQKVRLPSEIMEHKLATCLDLTLLFAALVEACNLNPVVVLIQGHAFIGVFLEDKHLRQVVVDASDDLKKFCYENVMLMIETTAVCHSTPFDVAVDGGMETLRTIDEDDFECAIDVKAARVNGVKQLSLGYNKISPPPKPQPSPTVPAAGGDGSFEAHITAMKKPSALMFDGMKVSTVGTWKDLFLKLLEKLNELSPSKFDDLPHDGLFGKYFIRLEQGKKTPRNYFKTKLGTNANIRAKELVNKVYLCRTDYYFRRLLDRFGVDIGRIKVI